VDRGSWIEEKKKILKRQGAKHAKEEFFGGRGREFNRR
jgi:hypothetical protein